MKIKTLLILFTLGFFEIFCYDDILSKFHQNGFKLRDIRAELKSYNKKYYKFFEVKTFKHNRSTAALNISFHTKIGVKDQTEMLVQGFKFLSNEYRHFPVRFQVNLKKAFDANIVGLQGINNCGNMSSFVFEKDTTYYLCNLVFDETRFPPLIPNGRYKLEIQFLYLGIEIALADGFGEIYTPIKYPRH